MSLLARLAAVQASFPVLSTDLRDHVMICSMILSKLGFMLDVMLLFGQAVAIVAECTIQRLGLLVQHSGNSLRSHSFCTVDGVERPGPHGPIQGLCAPTSVSEVLIKVYRERSHDQGACVPCACVLS